MSESRVDREIADLLSSQVPVENIVAQFCETCLASSHSFEDRAERLKFIYNCGYYQEVIETILLGLKTGLDMPLSFMIEILQAHGISPSEPNVRQFEHLNFSVDVQVDLARSWSWRKLSPTVREAMSQFKKQIEERATGRRDELFERLQFYRNERMLLEEQKTLAIIQRFFKDDPELPSFLEDFNDRWARHVIAEAGLKQLDTYENESQNAELDVDQWPMAHVLLDETTQLVEANPDRAYDLSLLFWFLELFPQALIIADKGVPSDRTTWYRIEVLLKLRRFIDALDELQKIESAQSADPEIPFAANYLRAQALHGLGQVTSAIEVMSSLVAIRPDYRSARSFLSEWTQGQGQS